MNKQAYYNSLGITYPWQVKMALWRKVLAFVFWHIAEWMGKACNLIVSALLANGNSCKKTAVKVRMAEALFHRVGLNKRLALGTMVIAISYALLCHYRFGTHFLPASDAELICDGIGILIALKAVSFAIAKD